MRPFPPRCIIVGLVLASVTGSAFGAEMNATAINSAAGSKALDGVEGGDNGVMVLRDGGILGGASFFYFIGTYSCSGGRWKGEITHQEHNPAPTLTTRWRDRSSAPGLPEHIATRVPNSKPRRSSASEAYGTTQACGCC
jgi:hypothetical protein